MNTDQTTSNASVSRSVFSSQFLAVTLSTLTLVALAAFDGMAVSAALPRIGADLGVESLSWVLTGFALTSTIALLISGAAIDALGVRVVYRFTIVMFLLGSVLCSFATNMNMLIAARLVQGIGGGLVMAVTIANVGLTYPADLRSRAYAANSTVWGVMAIAGPAAAAFVLNVVNWRWIFLVNVPLVALAAFVGWNRMGSAQHQRRPLVFDWRGVLLVGGFTAVMLLGISKVSNRTVPALVVAIILAGLYWVHSGRSAAPVLDRRHFARFPFGLLNLIPFTFFAGPLSIDAFIPIFVQGGLGKNTTTAAFAVAFLAIGWTTGSNIISRILHRVRNTTVMIAGFAVTLPSLALAATFSTTVPVAFVFLMSFLQGLGIGSMTNATLSLLQRLAKTEEMGRATAAHQFMRNFGSTIGTAVAGAVLFFVVDRRIGNVDAVRDLLADKEVAISRPTQEAIAAGFRGAAMVAFAVTTVGLAIALYVRKRFADEETSPGLPS